MPSRRSHRTLICAAQIAAFLLGLVSVSGCTAAHATGTSYPDYGDVLSLSGTAILANTGAYTTGTTVSVVGVMRLSAWVKIILSGGSGLAAGINVQMDCGYSASTDVLMPVTWSDQASPTVQQTTTLTATLGATTWHLIQTGAVTGAKAGCVFAARSANASAGSVGDSIDVYAYGM